jgi:tyrosine phenol-lyase
MVEPIRMTTRAERQKALEEAGYNTFLLRSEDVYIDLLTDSGTGAMSDRQWAGLMLGDEAYAGSRNFYHLQDTVRDVYGYKHTIPTHQGRAAEHLISQLLIKQGDIVPGNMYFTTTRLHQELAGGRFADVIIDEAHDPQSTHPFKGNVDLEKFQRLIDEHGADRIPYICIATAVNMCGGQPISLANLRRVAELAHAQGILVVHDMTRCAENALLIHEREPGFQDRSIAEIVRQICDLTDVATMSSKKDHLVNIGGFLAVNDDELAGRARNMVVIYEGLHTYGGMAGRDMEALAIGIRECIEYDHIHARVGQVDYLGRREALPAACGSGEVPSSGAGGGDLPRRRCSFDGAWHRVSGTRSENGQEPAAQTRAGSPDDSPSGVHAGAYGRSRGVDHGCLRPSRRREGSRVHVRTEAPSLLSGQVPADRLMRSAAH